MQEIDWTQKLTIMDKKHKWKLISEEAEDGQCGRCYTKTSVIFLYNLMTMTTNSGCKCYMRNM
jgi:hypothetical protein